MMPKRHITIPALVWQALLMGLLGVSGIIFVPLLLRYADAQQMSSVMVAHVSVYYLVMLVQFGIVISGPAAVARVDNRVGKVEVWQNAMQSKWLLGLPVTLLFGWAFASIAWRQWHLLWFALLIFAFAVNSNWFLQAQQNFVSGAAFAAFGVCLSLCMLWMLPPEGPWLVLILVMPQVCLGLGTWCIARRACLDITLGQSTWQDSCGFLRKDASLVVSQLLLLASTTLGTVVVGMLAEPETTAAYAAVEKLFNLGSTAMVGLYMALYPRFAEWFYSDRSFYWLKTKQLLLTSLGGGMLLAVLLHFAGMQLMALYLSESLASIVVPVLPVFALWLGLCLSQHVLTSHLVLAERKHMVLWANGCVLLATVVVGYACALTTPVAWVYGMVAGQVLALVWLLRICRQDKAMVV